MSSWSPSINRPCRESQSWCGCFWSTDNYKCNGTNEDDALYEALTSVSYNESNPFEPTYECRLMFSRSPDTEIGSSWPSTPDVDEELLVTSDVMDLRPVKSIGMIEPPLSDRLLQATQLRSTFRIPKNVI